ncbi:unnamed protein product [Linum tenue]|uniref:Receptor-interacting protein n=1 Tax=Linum tenue TaxID=586396 RepID=A0AAV0P9Y8_9ROSI|nr:unnamed protein product [Linum tenue]
MILLRPNYNNINLRRCPPFLSDSGNHNLQASRARQIGFPPSRRSRPALTKCSGGAAEGPRRRSFLSLEEAGLVEMSGLSSHERFLCRLTISSLNLLKVISEQEGCAIEELNAGKVCDWFLKDKLKREQNIDSAVLQWDDSEFPI